MFDFIPNHIFFYLFFKLTFFKKKSVKFDLQKAFDAILLLFFKEGKNWVITI